MKEIVPMLEPESGIPLYLQLYGRFKQEIEAGNWRAGDRLPSIRRMAELLGIGKNTVESAYQQLVSEGYAESRSRSGLRVLPLEPSMANRTLPTPTVRPAEPESPAWKYDFRYGRIDTAHFPYSAWKKCLTDALYDDPDEVLGYGHPQGLPELREEILAYLYESRGVRASADQLFLSSGTQQAIGMLCALAPLSGKRVAMENPGYDGVRVVLSDYGCEPVPIPLERDGIDVAALGASDAAAVYVTPSHQFPMGMVLPYAKRLKLLQWAADTGSYVIEDDYDSEFRYVGHPIPSLKALDREDRVIYLGTFSKSFLPSARICYTVAPEKLAARMRERLSDYSQSSSALLQRAAYRFMRGGHFSRHVRKTRRIYQAKHKKLLSAIERHMGDAVEVVGQKAGLHLLLDVKERPEADWIALAAAAGIKVYSPRPHWIEPNDCPAGHVMIGFGGLTEAEIEEGARLLAEVWGLGDQTSFPGNRPQGVVASK